VTCSVVLVSETTSPIIRGSRERDEKACSRIQSGTCPSAPERNSWWRARGCRPRRLPARLRRDLPVLDPTTPPRQPSAEARPIAEWRRPRTPSHSPHSQRSTCGRGPQAKIGIPTRAVVEGSEGVRHRRVTVAKRRRPLPANQRNFTRRDAYRSAAPGWLSRRRRGGRGHHACRRRFGSSRRSERRERRSGRGSGLSQSAPHAHGPGAQGADPAG